jgi:hypothetical protein
MSSGQVIEEQAKGGKGKQPQSNGGKAKPSVQGGEATQPQATATKETSATEEKKELTEEEKAERSAKIAERSANMAAFFTNQIENCTDSTVAAQIALMRFSKTNLSSMVDGKTFKENIGSCFLRYLGEHLSTVCELATSQFFDLLHMLPKAEQRAIIIVVLGYFTTESLLADEIGGDIPDFKRRKFHMLYLWGFQGKFYKRVCNYARTHLGARITHKWYFKVDGQAIFGDKAGVPITPSLQTVREKVTTIKAQTEKKMKDNTATMAKLELERITIAEKVKDLPKEKAAKLLQRLVTIDERIAELAVEQCFLQQNLDHVSKLLLAIPAELTPGTTAELFLLGENMFDDFSKFFGQNGIVLHNDPSLEISMPQSFDEIFEVLAAEPKYDNTLLKEINKKADAILLAHHVPKESAYRTEGAVLQVTVTFPSDVSVPCDAPTITCMLKLKHPNMAPM